MKKKIIVAAVLFAVSFVIEGIASKILPFNEIVNKFLPSKNV